MTRLVEQSDYAPTCCARWPREGVEVDQFHPEYAAGQYEVSVGAARPGRRGRPQRAGPADDPGGGPARTGCGCRSRPAVLAGGVGNGGHLHVSVWRDGRNLHAGGDGRHGMTAEAEGFLAGVLDQLPALAALLTPEPGELPADAAVALGRGVRRLGPREPRGRRCGSVTGTVGEPGPRPRTSR